MPFTRARGAAGTARRVREAPGGASSPRPRRGTVRIAAMAAAAAAAKKIVSHGEKWGPTPAHIRTPTTTTATKFTELLMRKNASERRAIFWVGMPPSRRIHAPSARPPIPLAGTIDPIPSSDQAISALVLRDMWLQKIGRNITWYERPDSASNTTASTIHPGLASPR